ncbi:Putative rhamnose biosynthetic enzyme 1 [Durusdinium trenchii]|uniref:Rhamnose biosynthetic enzyme 1 n=1 Tax=Durusdinium trenchii TaxID=1381693 RepID=A0ABP0M795_9DINO
MDLTTDIGFSNCLYHACNLREGAACMAAPVCGSFVFMSRGSTGRSVANPMGFGESCRIGNLLVSRTLVIMLICAAKCVWFCLEQPGTSIMELHTLFQRFIKIAALRKLKINMGDYGAPTLKPTILYSSHRAIDMLPNYTIRRQLVKKHMVKRYVDGNGKQRVCGGVDLKTSQAYPKHFGVALAACRSATAANRRLTAKRFLEVARRSSNEADGRRHIDKVWRDAAQLDSVIKFLTQRP